MSKNIRTSEHQNIKIYAVILVGGKGKRLRPLSKNERPKAFLSIMRDRKTMFKTTVERIKKLIPPKQILVSANRRHSRLVKRDFPTISRKNLILEPVSRNTAPAIGLAASLLKKTFKDPVMVVIPADQYVMDEKEYLNIIKQGISFASNNDALVLLALRPTYPTAEFGYVKVKSPVTSRQSPVIYKIEKFIEKPDFKTAKRFIKDGRYFWNAGAFVFKVSAILNAIKRFAPRIFDILNDLNKINKNYKKMPDISIDYAVMEKAKNIYCVKGAYRWQDIGSFKALKEVLEREGRDFIWKNRKVVSIKS